jgi:hypothetical protein
MQSYLISDKLQIFDKKSSILIISIPKTEGKITTFYELTPSFYAADSLGYRF